MLCVQEKGLFFCHLLLFSCYLHTQTEILNLISSRLCALYFVHFAFRAFAHPFHVFVVTKAEQIINPHFVPGEIPKQGGPASPQKQPGIFPVSSAVFLANGEGGRIAGDSLTRFAMAGSSQCWSVVLMAHVLSSNLQYSKEDLGC